MSMAEIEVLIMKEVKEFIRKLRDIDIRVEDAYIFGSYARKTQNKWSDIDLAIISPDFSDDRFEERVRLMKLASSIDDRIEPVPFRPDNFSEDNPLAWEIKRHGIQVKGD